MEDNNQLTKEMMRKAVLAIRVSEGVVGKSGMRVVKSELNRLSTADVAVVWYGVYRLLRGDEWPEGGLVTDDVRQMAYFIAALVQYVPWPEHAEMLAKLGIKKS